MIFFLFLHKNTCCWYSLEVPPRGASNEYPQNMFLWRNKKDISIFWMKKVPNLLLCGCILDSQGCKFSSCRQTLIRLCRCAG